MATRPKIHRADAADAAEVAAFARQCFLDAFSHNNTPDHLFAYVEDAFDVGRMRTDLGDQDAIYLLAREADDAESLLGYAKLQFHSPIECLADMAPAKLERIYVGGKFQQRGIGGILLSSAIERAKAASAKILWLSVWEENKDAQRFYERHGFAPVGTTFFMFGPERQRDVVMAKRLS